MESKSIRRRVSSFAIFAAILVPSCGPGSIDDELPQASPGLESGRDDYRAARSQFQTRLIRQGPLVPEAKPARKPAGAVEIEYPTSGSALRAYASPVSKGSRDRPAVLFLHGGFGFGEAHWAMTRPFRDAGYVVMIPTLRGEDGQPGRFSLFFDEVEDVLAAAECLAAHPDVDLDRVFIAEHSVGGTLALLAAMTSPRFRAAASFSGSPDQVEYTRGRPELIPFDPSDREEFRLRSPVAFATSFLCPTRLYFGDEELWLQNPSRRTAILARRAGLDVEAIELPGGHDSAVPDAIVHCLRFFASQ